MQVEAPPGASTCTWNSMLFIVPLPIHCLCTFHMKLPTNTLHFYMHFNFIWNKCRYVLAPFTFYLQILTNTCITFFTCILISYEICAHMDRFLHKVSPSPLFFRTFHLKFYFNLKLSYLHFSVCTDTTIFCSGWRCVDFWWFFVRRPLQFVQEEILGYFLGQ